MISKLHVGFEGTEKKQIQNMEWEDCEWIINTGGMWITLITEQVLFWGWGRCVYGTGDTGSYLVLLS